jgi:hypothetical protein
VLRNVATAVVSASVLVTVNSGFFQARPPDPEEADRSTDRELQPLRVEAMKSATTGAAGLWGAATWTEAKEADAQLLQVVGCVHCALTLLVDTSVTVEPIASRRSAETMLLGITAMVESSAQEHVAALAAEKLSTRVQVNAFVNPPRLVAESNLTSTLLPSLLKVADSSCGTAGAAVLLRTLKEPSADVPTGYSLALTPENCARMVYTPGVAPIKVTLRERSVEVLVYSSVDGENARSAAPPALVSTAVS